MWFNLPQRRAAGLWAWLWVVSTCFWRRWRRFQLASAAKTEAFRISLEKKYEQIPPEIRQEPDLKIAYQITWQSNLRKIM